MEEETGSLIATVDDEASIREAVSSLLESNGFAAATFSSAEEFLNSPAVAKTRCLLLDISMPGMSGLTLQCHLASARPHIPIIFITALDNQIVRSQAMRAGAVDFLSKPFSETALLQAIRSALTS